MSSVAQRHRAKREATRIRAETPRPDAPARPKTQPKRYQHETGLAWLHHKGQINRTQAETGKRYGTWYRTAQLSDPNSLRSCLNDSPRGGSGSTGASTLVEDTVVWWNECREKVNLCHSKVSYHAGLVMALDLVCGRQMRPTEIIPDNQREREEIVTSLRIALDMLEKVR